MSDISLWLQITFSGLSMGAVYALLAVSLVMVYRVSKIVCFAQGEFFVLGGLTLSTLTGMGGLSVWAAIPITLVLAALLGLVIERAVIERVKNEGVATVIVMTIALSITLQGIALPTFGAQAHIVSPFINAPPLEILGAFISTQVLLAIGAALLIFGALYLYFERTTLGLAMRAAAHSPDGARLVGISVKKLTRYGWATGVALGALAGIIISPVIFMTYSAGTLPMMKAFVAMAIGGLNSTTGALIGGFSVGLLEAYTVAFVSSEFADAFVFIFLIFFLIWRPNGLFGSDDKGGM